MSLDLPELDWQVQTRAIEQIKTPHRMLRDLIFKQENHNEADTVEVDVTVGGRKLAPFVTDVEGGKIIEATKRSAKAVKTPRIRLKHPMTGKDLLTQRGPGQTYYAGGITDIMTAKKKKIATEQQNLKNLIENRKEWMCAQALTGKVTVVQDNISFEVDYQMPAAQKVVLTSGNKWTDNVNVRKQIRAWAQTMINKGYTPNLMICGTDAAGALDDRITADSAFDARHITAGEFSWKATSNYMGNLGGIDAYTYGAAYENDASADVNLIPANKVYLVATTARFTIEYGIILDLDADAQVVGPYFSKAWVQKDPSALWVLAESRPLPVLWEPEAVMEIQVVD